MQIIIVELVKIRRSVLKDIAVDMVLCGGARRLISDITSMLDFFFFFFLKFSNPGGSRPYIKVDCGLGFGFLPPMSF